MTLKKLFTFLIIFISVQFKAYSAETYLYGGAKIFNYGIEESDLQEINTSLVALGFSSSTSSTDNTGIGFDIGFGAEISPNLSIEAGYVNYGTLTINTKLTGPTENVTTDITGDGVTGAAKFSQEGLDELTNLSGQGRPIPGQSLTNSPESTYPWESPATLTNPREALDSIVAEIMQPEAVKNVVNALAKGGAVGDIASAILYAKFTEGEISIDTMMLLAEPIMYTLMAIGEEANIKYNIEGNDLDEFDEEDEAEEIDNKINQFKTAVSDIKNKTTQKLKPTVDTNVVPQNILDKVKQQGTEIRSLLSKGEE